MDEPTKSAPAAPVWQADDRDLVLLSPVTTVESPEQRAPRAARPSVSLFRLAEQSPFRWREIVAIFLLVALSDVTIYHGAGFAGLALFFVAAAGLLAVGAPQPCFGRGVWIVVAMLALLAGKLLWCGSPLLVAAGFVLLIAVGMCLSGQRPYPVELVVFASQSVLGGYRGLIQHGRFVTRASPRLLIVHCLSVLLPLLAFVSFGLLFILANPDLGSFFDKTVQSLLSAYAPHPLEVVFWGVVAWLAIGLLRPVVSGGSRDRGNRAESFEKPGPAQQPPAFLYTALRNTLLTVIALFAVYLGFEFKTLWFRTFPAGFHYSGYAHEGAAWLTVALALATALLSLVFRGQILRDPQLPRLRTLAWLWSLENVLLAVAVYNRLFIYIGFNGLTRMRMIGLFGISTVVVGFLLVLWKIRKNRDFVWLLRHQLWALGIAVYLYALLPVDTIVVDYNVRRILAGDPAPSVQISRHPISAEGVLLLEPLLNCDDAVIREGVRAMLAQRHRDAEHHAVANQRLGWTTFQLSDRMVLRRLRDAQPVWVEYEDSAARAAVLERFHQYAYQWW